MKENKNRRSGANTQQPKYHQLVPNHYKKNGPTVKGFRGCGLVEGGKEPIFNFQPGPFLGKYFAGMTFCPKVVCGHNEQFGVATQLYGLGTMNVASFQESTIDLTSKVWVRNLGTVLGRCQAPKATVGSFFGQYPSPSDNEDPWPPKVLHFFVGGLGLVQHCHIGLITNQFMHKTWALQQIHVHTCKHIQIVK